MISVFYCPRSMLGFAHDLLRCARSGTRASPRFMTTRVPLPSLPCIRSVLWTKDHEHSPGRTADASKVQSFDGPDPLRSHLEAATSIFARLWSSGRVKFEKLPGSGTTFADMTIDAGEISLRVVGSARTQVAVVVVPRGSDTEIEKSRKSLVRSLRKALEDELQGRTHHTTPVQSLPPVKADAPVSVSVQIGGGR